MPAALPRRRARGRRASEAEAALWTHLRGRRLAGFEFRRRHPCGPFVLDFFCPARRLAVELAGRRRRAPRAARDDSGRARFIEARGIAVLRFSTDRIFRDREAVLLAIVFALDGRLPPR